MNLTLISIVKVYRDIRILSSEIVLPKMNVLRAIRRGDFRVLQRQRRDWNTPIRGRLPLHTAIAHNQPAVVQWLLERGADPNRRDFKGRTAVEVAAIHGHDTLVWRLLDAGGDIRGAAVEAYRYGHRALAFSLLTPENVNNRDRFSNTILWVVNVKDVDRVLAMGADPNIQNNIGETPLIAAAYDGEVGVIRALLPWSDPNLRDAAGRTALRWAILQGHARVVALLAPHTTISNAGTTVALYHPDTLPYLLPYIDINAAPHGRTLLFYAVMGHHTRAVEILLQWGADPDAGVDRPLLDAIWRGFVQIINLLLDAGAKIEKGDARRAISSNQKDALWRLLMAGAPIGGAAIEAVRQNATLAKMLTTSANVNTQNQEGETLLIKAIRHNQPWQWILAYDPNVNIHTRQGTSAFSALLEQGQPEQARQLIPDTFTFKDMFHALFYPDLLETILARGADPNCTERYNILAAAVAMDQAPVQSVRLLLEWGADPNKRQPYEGNTPIFLVPTTEQRLPKLELLLEAGADVNVQNDEGATPLHVAARHGQFRVAQRLLRAGADLHIQTRDGETPLDVARRSNHPHMVSLLTSD